MPRRPLVQFAAKSVHSFSQYRVRTIDNGRTYNERAGREHYAKVSVEYEQNIFMASSSKRSFSTLRSTMASDLCSSASAAYDATDTSAVTASVRLVFRPVPNIFLLLGKNTEPIAMKFAEGNHYHEQIE